MFRDWKNSLKLKRIKYLTYLGVVLLSITVLSGCGTLQTLVQNDGETTPLADWIGGMDQEATIPATSNLGDGKMISLYFPDSTGKALVKEERTLPKTLSLARETVNQWLIGPAVKGSAQNAVDPATTLIDIGIKDGVATVDLSPEFTEVFGKVSQEVAVYGLVNTLTQFPTVQEVKIRIEGKALTKLGSLDLKSLSYREGLVKGSNTVKSSGSEGSSGLNSGTNTDKETKQNPSSPELPDSPSSMNLFSAPASTI